MLIRSLVLASCAVILTACGGPEDGDLSFRFCTDDVRVQERNYVRMRYLEINGVGEWNNMRFDLVSSNVRCTGFRSVVPGRIVVSLSAGDMPAGDVPLRIEVHRYATGTPNVVATMVLPGEMGPVRFFLFAVEGSETVTVPVPQ